VEALPSDAGLPWLPLCEDLAVLLVVFEGPDPVLGLSPAFGPGRKPRRARLIASSSHASQATIWLGVSKRIALAAQDGALGSLNGSTLMGFAELCRDKKPIAP